MKQSTAGAVLTGIAVFLILVGARSYFVYQPDIEKCDNPHDCYLAERGVYFALMRMAFGSILLTLGLTILLFFRMPRPETWGRTCPRCRSIIDPNHSPIHCVYCGMPMQWSSDETSGIVSSGGNTAPDSRRVKR